MREQREDLSADDLVRRQLTLRAVVWDLADINKKETARLEQELELFEIWRNGQEEPGAGRFVNGQEESGAEKYKKICRMLERAGYADDQAVLVTGDAQLSSYVYSLKDVRLSGMAVVYYEKIYDKEGYNNVEYNKEEYNKAVSFLKQDMTEQNEQEFEQVSADMIVQGFEEIGVQFLDRVLKRRNGLPWTILYTERTCVREIELSDLDELYELYDGEGITDYTEPLFERHKEEEYTQSYIAYMYHYYGYGMWVVRDRKTGKLIGRAGIEHHEGCGGKQSECCKEVLMELGYIIRREYQRQGYALEVCRAIIEYAQDELEIDQLHCFVHPDNIASICVAEKLGFSRCGLDCGSQEHMIHFCKELKKER